ncbi:MAG: hypothetical protein EKK48_24380 [Candidatus Melainabacteria bacterium]|nr:MAG: hypothetical protein EKK48_24380 [Candidatus Melainabacteria bacterium]
MSYLTLKQRQILNYRFGLKGEPRTLRELGELYQVSHESIRALERRALRKIDLRRSLSSSSRRHLKVNKQYLPTLTGEEKNMLLVLWGIDDGIWKDYQTTAALVQTTIEVVYATESKALASLNRC